MLKSSQKICATIEARMNSTRLPGKVMLPLMGKPMLEHIVLRLKSCPAIDEVIVATTTDSSDDLIEDFCKEIKCSVYRGSVDNIVERLLGASQQVNAEFIVQATGDNPVIDPVLVNKMISIFFSNRSTDYVANNLTESFPRGFDVRMFSREALLKVDALTNDPIDLVHGSYFIYRRPDLFNIVGFEAEAEYCWPELRLTVDEPLDYKLVKHLYQALYHSNPYFGVKEIISYFKAHPALATLNSVIKQKNVAEG